jgi:3-methyladenine DNA glycosylase/8-oxoguanine DNA glycosylase
MRALVGSREPVSARVTQGRPETLAGVLGGDEREHHRALALVHRMLGVDRDLTHCDRTAESIPLLKRWRLPCAAPSRPAMRRSGRRLSA